MIIIIDVFDFSYPTQSMKCEQYWPNEYTMAVYGGVKVTCQREQKYAEFVIRTFLVQSVSQFLGDIR